MKITFCTIHIKTLSHSSTVDARRRYLCSGGHVSSGPSIAPRALDHLDLLKQASAAVLTQDHDYSGGMTAALIRNHRPDLPTKLYSSSVLNNVVGGFTPMRSSIRRR